MFVLFLMASAILGGTRRSQVLLRHPAIYAAFCVAVAATFMSLTIIQ